MVLMDNQARDKWSSIVRDKLAYMITCRTSWQVHLHVWQTLSITRCPRASALCVSVLRSTGLCVQSLFERGGAGDVADQLWAYGNSNGRHRLEDFPLAWVEIQERAFCTNVERTTERQHVLVKLGGRRSLRFFGPAMTCVRARRAQLQAMIDNPSVCGFLLQRWRKKALFSDLLSHVVTLHRMTIVETVCLQRS